MNLPFKININGLVTLKEDIYLVYFFRTSVYTVCEYVCVCMCVCVYIYIYICMYILLHHGDGIHLGSF